MKEERTKIQLALRASTRAAIKAALRHAYTLGQLAHSDNLELSEQDEDVRKLDAMAAELAKAVTP